MPHAGRLTAGGMQERQPWHAAIVSERVVPPRRGGPRRASCAAHHTPLSAPAVHRWPYSGCAALVNVPWPWMLRFSTTTRVALPAAPTVNVTALKPYAFSPTGW
jgi:hypothetical protein